LEAGFDLFLTKPIDREKLLEALACYLPISEINKIKVDNPEGDFEAGSEANLNLQQHFFNSLVFKISNITDFYKSKSFDLLAKELHQLKGSSGFYGYPILVQIAEKIEFELKNNGNDNDILNLVKELAGEVNKIII
jgi:HPt (histidine-containing phosphotransfer) domain-containing protein